MIQVPSPRRTHIGDVAVQPPEVLLDRLDRLLDRLVLGHFALIRLDLDAEPLRQLGRPLLHVRRRAVQQGDVAAGFGDRFRCGETDPATAAGDGRHFTLHAKHAVVVVGQGRGSARCKTSSERSFGEETHSKTELGSCGVALGNGPSLGLDLWAEVAKSVLVGGASRRSLRSKKRRAHVGVWLRRLFRARE
jgi:hypothetical protein